MSYRPRNGQPDRLHSIALMRGSCDRTHAWGGLRPRDGPARRSHRLSRRRTSAPSSHGTLRRPRSREGRIDWPCESPRGAPDFAAALLAGALVGRLVAAADLLRRWPGALRSLRGDGSSTHRLISPSIERPGREETAMSVASGRSLAACLVWGVLLGTFGCAPRWTPPPRTIGRVAVLPPCDVNGAPFGGARPSATSPAPAMGLGAGLMSAAGNELTAREVRVWDAAEVAAATGGRVPATPEMAANIVAAAKIDATALFIRVRRWEYPYPALKADEIIVGLDVMLVDPATREIRVGGSPSDQAGAAPWRADGRPGRHRRRARGHAGGVRAISAMNQAGGECQRTQCNAAVGTVERDTEASVDRAAFSAARRVPARLRRDRRVGTIVRTPPLPRRRRVAGSASRRAWARRAGGPRPSG